MSTWSTRFDFLRRLWLLLCISVLAACGGGGGGGGPSIILPPPLQPSGDDDDDTRLPGDPLPLTTDNAEPVMTFALAYPESMQQLFAAVLEAIGELILADGGTSVTICDGNATIELDDRDSSRSLTDRDELIITYSNCASEGLNETVSGSIRVEFTEAQLFSGGSAILEGSLGNDIQFQFDGSTVSVTGGYDFTFNKTNNLETLSVTPGPGTRGGIAITVDGISESLSEFSMTRTFAETEQRMTLAFTGTIRSSALIGTTTCTITDVVTEVSSEPSQGNVTCTGADSTLRLVAGGDLELARGGGDFSTVLSRPSWQQFVEGALLTGAVFRDLPVGSTLTPRVEIANRFNIDIIDAVYSDVRDRIYLATDNSIHILTPLGTLAEAEIVPLDEIPRVVALNRAQDTLYVGSSESPSLRALNLDDGTLGPMVTFGDDPDEVRRQAASILVLDDAAERLLVGTDGGDALVLEAGVLLPDEAFSGGPNLAQTDDGLLWSTNRFRDLNQLIVSATGVSTANEVDFESFGPIFNAGNLLVTESGQVLDPRLGLKVAEADISIFEGGGGNYDRYSDRIYRFSGGGRILAVWETDNFTPTGTYLLPDDRRYTRLISGNGLLMMFDASEMAVVDLITLEDYPLRTCEALRLADLTEDSTGFQIDCAFNHAIYDPGRDRVFASVPAEIGTEGNSVLRINPYTGVIEESFPVGSNPNRLVRTQVGDHLLITYETSNQVGMLNLNTGEVTRLGPALSRIAADVAEAPFVADRYLVSLRDSVVSAIIDGELAERSAGFSGPRLQFDPTQEGRAFSLSGNRLIIYNVDATGVTQVETNSDTLFGFSWAEFRDQLFTSGGDRYNPATGVVELNIDIEQSYISIDPVLDWAVFSSGRRAQIYRGDNGDFIGEVEFPFINEPFDMREVLADPPEHLIGVFADSMIIAPKDEIYPE